MLILTPQVHIVSREITAPNGELVRAFFAIIEENGGYQVRFLGMKPIESASRVLLLENSNKQTYPEAPVASPFEKVSHYFSLDFLVNQLARAPSRI